MEVSPSEVRIEHSVADQLAVRRAFTGLYAGLAGIGVVVAMFLVPELRLGAAFFVALVLWWVWSMRRHEATVVPWVVLLTPHELRHTHHDGDVRVLKAEAATVRLVQRAGPRRLLHVLEVRGRQGEDLLTISLPGRDESTMLEAAFEEWGWPLSARRR